MQSIARQVSAPTGTKEWAASNINVCQGCSHGCHYCYAKSMAIRFGRCASPADWLVEQPQPRKAARRVTRRDGRIMFPSSHDITPGISELCLVALRHILESGNEGSP